MERSHNTSLNETNGNAEVEATDYLSTCDGGSVEGDDVFVLPPSFVPGKWDVICQRGKECFEHVGNRRFRVTIESHLEKYMEVKSRQQKSRIVSSIVDGIKHSAGQEGGGFVRKDLLTRQWFRVSDKLAREKVGQALRDAIKTRRTITKKSLLKKSDSPPGFQSLPDHPDTISSSSRLLGLRQQQVLTSVPAPLSHSSDSMPLVPFMDRSIVGDFEPRPLSVPLKLNDFLSNSGGDEEVQPASNDINNQFEQQQTEVNITPSIPTMNASLSSILGGSAASSESSQLQYFFPSNQSHLFPSAATMNALPQHQQNSGANSFSTPGLAQLFSTVPGQTVLAAQFSSSTDFSSPSFEQQQMLSSVIGDSRLPSNNGSGAASGKYLQDGQAESNTTFANTWLCTNIHPLDVNNTASFIVHKRQQIQHVPVREGEQPAGEVLGGQRTSRFKDAGI
ncbi:hypothetical protein IV203_011566 [Nitzschia inconspicua]|uniref:DUF6824 domain-containing protein n=1 Tax=Nitzschia inconspicua TaxID=303405 RepID=A0A9K3KTE1_9STRA|nr:hypothetical protein IV203_011566 [Nitzschia inconspicua]